MGFSLQCVLQAAKKDFVWFFFQFLPGLETECDLSSLDDTKLLRLVQYVNSKQLILQVFILQSLYIVLYMYSYCYESSMSAASSSYSRYSYFSLSTLYYTCIHTVTRAVCQQQAAHTPGIHTSVPLHCIMHVFILLQEQYVIRKQLILHVFIL